MIYDYDEIKEKAHIPDVLDALGIPKSSNGRYIATWRGGKNGNVEITKAGKGWKDHKTKEYGSVLDIVAKIQNTEPFIASNWLGDYLGLNTQTQVRQVGNSRYHELLKIGYKEIKRYDYTDANKTLVQQVVRMEHPNPTEDLKRKEFLQCDPNGRWTVKRITPVLYNMPMITESNWAIIVEGEKDADTLIARGFPATTNPGGAEKWRESFSEVLFGKDVVIVADNDDSGKHHTNIVGLALTGRAKSIKVVEGISKLPKGDVTDWFEKEGGTDDAFMQICKDSKLFQEPENDEMELAEAKKANEEPFANYTKRKVEVQDDNGKTKKKIIKEPRINMAMIRDMSTRFLGFPRRIGDSELFDFDRETKEIRIIRGTESLLAWVQEKSGKRVPWAVGEEYTTKGEFRQSVLANAHKYEGISEVPEWPEREEMFYSYKYSGAMPPPSENYSAFNKLLSFFAPASEEDAILIKTMFCAPLYFEHKVDRPLWIIDSKDGQGTGKSTLARMVAELYKSTPVEVGRDDFTGRDFMELTKRLLSSEGRRSKVVLIDNVTGEFRSPNLARLVTASDITGRSAYGHGEEVRKNNLTYILTANSASVDSDLTTRAFFVYVKSPDMRVNFKSELLAHIETHRFQILADMIDILKKPHALDGAKPLTRFPEFESRVLHPLCQNEDTLQSVMNNLNSRREAANTDEILAQRVEDVITDGLSDTPGCEFYWTKRIYISSDVLKKWLSEDSDLKKLLIPHDLRNLAKQKHIKSLRSDPERLGTGRWKKRVSGIMYVGKDAEEDLEPDLVLTWNRKQRLPETLTLAECRG